MSHPSELIGSIGEFDSSRDDWNVYYERLEQFYEVNEVPEVKRSAFLISVVGTDAYKSLRDLCHPTLPKDKPFEALCELLRKQFSPQISIFRERTKFYNARQESHENVTQWYGKLKRLSVDCKFGSNLEAVLLDKFITGMRPGQVLDRLCEENETLKLDQALDYAVNKECAAKENAYAPNFQPFRGGCIPPPVKQTCFFGGQPAGPLFGSTGFGQPSLAAAGRLPKAGGLGGTLFGSSPQASAPAAGFAAAFGQSAAPQSSSIQPQTLMAADPAPALDCTLEAETEGLEADGTTEGVDLALGAGAVKKRSGHRTRRRRRNAAGGAADGNSVDGEQWKIR
ncbi:uncharacterized protein LOC129768834 [Toxorhynchites rutilus septentrionalis]|uniref:uncharacterized protein LOC129768834 n=1 Tax=Toxorhynchites rutilus septentrionalis TaxID=329112 RepID=UPI002479C583|nr:uncharacterized protein LOC129768834 [Toxorhynchites rutilus septentrionalis]